MGWMSSAEQETLQQAGPFRLALCLCCCIRVCWSTGCTIHTMKLRSVPTGLSRPGWGQQQGLVAQNTGLVSSGQ